VTGRRKIIKGIPISSGIVLGRASVVMPGDIRVPEMAIPHARLQSEADALEEAVELTVEELRNLQQSAGAKIGGPVTKIFDAQLLIASDYEFLKNVKNQIFSTRRNAGFVYNDMVRRTVAPLKRSNEAYMRQTAVDIEAVAGRVLSHLTGSEEPELRFPPNTILVGKNFSPGDILTYRQRKILGFVVAEGGADSHMALIARSLMLPVVLAGDAWRQVPNNSRLIMDGTTGEVVVHPTDDDWSEYQRRRRRQGPALITRIKRLPHIPPLTKDGVEVPVAANLSLPGPVDDILAENNIPVGLYRTEFLYLAEGSFPDEESQYRYYSNIAAKFRKQSVVLRTFDLGYDKMTDDSLWPQENNPALGWRGIRAMLEMTDVFKMQIRAILRASVHGHLKIMLPMISELSELERAKKLISQAKLSLRRRKQAFKEDIEIGIMVEVPSAALVAETLAAKVDFLSIGTNDLTQYTMAADRMNNRVAELYNPYHPSVLNLIYKTVSAGKKFGKPVSICGELAGDMMTLPLFIGMEVDQLSMTPNRIVDLCRTVKKIDSRLVKHLVEPVLAAGSKRAVKHVLENYRSELEKKKL